MGLWDMLRTLAAALLILIVVLATVIACVVGVIVIGGLIMMAKDSMQEMQMNALPDRMMEQAAAGLKEREERSNDAGRRGDTKTDEYRQDNSRKDG